MELLVDHPSVGEEWSFGLRGKKWAGQHERALFHMLLRFFLVFP